MPTSLVEICLVGAVDTALELVAHGKPLPGRLDAVPWTCWDLLLVLGAGAHRQDARGGRQLMDGKWGAIGFRYKLRVKKNPVAQSYSYIYVGISGDKWCLGQ